METFGNKNLAKSCIQYTCEMCDFVTSNKYNYTCHNNTIKHIGNILETLETKTCKKTPIECNTCGKTYLNNSGLWKHKKKCNEEPSDKKLILDVLQQNKELNQLLIEQTKQNSKLQEKVIELCQNGTNNNNTINSHNKTFNLQFFLNETCKDAMNIMDFVDSVKLQLTDLENVGKHGFVEGISNIITSKLNLLEENKRPIHCTDAKRETLYVKDENKWEKESEDKKKIRKVIKKVADKNFKLFPEFKEKHPDYCNSESNTSDRYQQMMFESMGGEGDDDAEKEDKIIKNISKEVIVLK